MISDIQCNAKKCVRQMSIDDRGKFVCESHQMFFFFFNNCCIYFIFTGKSLSLVYAADRDSLNVITKTCPCNIQKKNMVKKNRTFSLEKNLIFFLFLLKT